MTIRFFINKPQVLTAVQWTGSNFAEVDDFCSGHATWFQPLVDNEDGTLTLSEQTGGYVVNESDWLSTQGPIADVNMSGFQEVPSTSYLYTTEEEV